MSWLIGIIVVGNRIYLCESVTPRQNEESHANRSIETSDLKS